jgi:hypothetical protein
MNIVKTRAIDILCLRSSIMCNKSKKEEKRKRTMKKRKKEMTKG